MAINQVIYCVREGPFSIEFMTCCKKQMLQRYWKFAGYIIIWRERATVKSRGAVLHNDSTASWYVKMRWPHWTAPRLWQNPYYTCILSHDYSPQIMFWWSDSSKTKEAALIIWHFSGQEKKRRWKEKLHQTSFIIGFFFSIQKQQLSFWLLSFFYQPDIEVFVSLNGCLSKNANFFPMQQQSIDGFGVNVSGQQQREKPAGRSWFGFCPFLLTLQLIDERVCGELSWTHLLLFQREVCKS